MKLVGAWSSLGAAAGKEWVMKTQLMQVGGDASEGVAGVKGEETQVGRDASGGMAGGKGEET